MSGSCTWCGDLVKERRYFTEFEIVSSYTNGVLLGGGIQPVFSDYDVQVNGRNLVVYNVSNPTFKHVAETAGNKLSLSSYLSLLKNGVELERQFFKVSTEQVRVIGMPSKNHIYLGEVNLVLPDPNELKETDKIEIKLVTMVGLFQSEGLGGKSENEVFWELKHDEVSYDYER